MKTLKKLLLFVVASALLAGCTSYKNVPYMQNPEVVNSYREDLPLYDAKIMPKDLLSITVNTSDPQAAAPFNLTVQTPLNAALTNINTTTQLQPYLKESPIVTVRMANYKISVLGEVNRPGTFTVGNEKVNILEALAMAGDMTVYGVRDNVKLIREDAKGKREIINLNLNNAELVVSPYYYLRQNDIIYVTPNKTKAKNSDIGSSTSIWISATSILVSLASLLATILK